MGEREAYQRRYEAQLKEWAAQIDLLKAKAEKAQADASVEYFRQIEALQAQQKEAQQRFHAMVKSSDAAWRDMMAKTEAAWRDISDGMRKAWERFH